MAGELADFGNRIAQIVDPAALQRISAKAGKEAKEAIEKAASGDLGGDRKMSNLRRGGRLTAKVSEGQTTSVDLTPSGQWGLAQSGRRSSGKIRPRGRAVLTPRGPRAWSSYGPSRGTQHHL